jgi:hypothetical protein
MKTSYLLCCLAALLYTGVARGEAPLFASDAGLTLTIPVDFSALCRPRESEDCDFTPTVLSYRNGPGDERSLPVEVKVRGGWRSLSRNCSAPLLWVRFAAENVAGTPFEGQTLLPLTTHCGKGTSVAAVTRPSTHSDFEQYLLREFLGHRIYNVLTDQSVRARLVRIAYPDPGRPDRLNYHYAFFTEHFDSVAARTGSERLPRGSFDYSRLDAQAAARLALFQFMLGNTDWSIVRERNTMLMQNGAGMQVPVPYDMDMSGLVATDYAGPAPGLPIDDVRERLYLGFCQPGIDWDALRADFGSKKKAILGLTEQVPGFSRGSKSWTQRYLESFFDLLGSAEKWQERVVGACRPWPPSPVDHTSHLDDS